MRIFVVTDTHRFINGVEELLIRDKPDALFHLGDFLADANALRAKFPDVDIYSVPGNCDLEQRTELELVLDGYRFFLCHGHQYGVKRDLNRLSIEAKIRRCDAVFFGHTHQRHLSRDDMAGFYLMNPGSAFKHDGVYYGVVETKSKLKIELKTASFERL